VILSTNTIQYLENYKLTNYLNGMRPRGAPRKLWCAGQRWRNGVRQSPRYAMRQDGRRPVRVRQGRITARRGRTAPLTALASCACPRTGLALLNK
ncbi:MAG: hypothetical protein ACK56I_24925, partial [bacterium]